MNIKEDFLGLVGKTPIIKLNNFIKNNNLNANVYAKLEYFNPAGSIKDRVAKAMIEDAKKQGLINKDSIIVEPTSGNTGIGLAAVCASEGYKAIFVMPETMSIERRKLLKAYGAQIVLTQGSLGMSGAIAKAEEMAKENPNIFIPGQFVNKINPQAHFETTGPEIFEDMDGKVDVFISGIGTGGTVSGAGAYLKSKNPNIKIIGVEPAESPAITEKRSGPHGIQGIGAGFIPETLNTEVFDEIITVKTSDAIETAKEVAKTQGVLVGISSGAALYASKVMSERFTEKGINIVAILPDTGERYLSTALFDD